MNEGLNIIKRIQNITKREYPVSFILHLLTIKTPTLANLKNIMIISYLTLPYLSFLKIIVCIYYFT